jgi:hypothetical protein
LIARSRLEFANRGKLVGKLANSMATLELIGRHQLPLPTAKPCAVSCLTPLCKI